MKVFPMTIKTKRRYELCSTLNNNQRYVLISITHNPATESGVSMTVILEGSQMLPYVADSSFFRLNSIKVSK